MGFLITPLFFYWILLSGIVWGKHHPTFSNKIYYTFRLSPPKPTSQFQTNIHSNCSYDQATSPYRVGWPFPKWNSAKVWHLSLLSPCEHTLCLTHNCYRLGYYSGQIVHPRQRSSKMGTTFHSPPAAKRPVTYLYLAWKVNIFIHFLTQTHYTGRSMAESIFSPNSVHCG